MVLCPPLTRLCQCLRCRKTSTNLLLAAVVSFASLCLWLNVVVVVDEVDTDYGRSLSQLQRHHRRPRDAVLRLVNVTVPAARTPCKADDAAYMLFKPRLNDSERAVLMRTMRVLHDTLEANNISYHLYAGSLLGTWRHHGLMPADDDVDIRVSRSNLEDLKRILGQLEPDYRLSPGSSHKIFWKFYAMNGTLGYNGTQFTWRYPFVDIFFYQETRTQIHDNGNATRRNISKSLVFPLVKRPFMDMWLYAPKDPLSYMQLVQPRLAKDLSKCKTLKYDHRKEKLVRGGSMVVDCHRLWNCYPFVFRQPAPGGGTLEKLIIGGEILQTIIVK